MKDTFFFTQKVNCFEDNLFLFDLFKMFLTCYSVFKILFYPCMIILKNSFMVLLCMFII